MHLNPGKYKLEAYGACGGGDDSVYTSARLTNGSQACIDDSIVQKYKGNANCNIKGSQPGAGGYASAVITLKHSVHVFIVIGGKGIYSTTGPVKGGFNGGGSTIHQNAGSGGGATDFRATFGSIWSTPASLKSRFLVAGGSGGSHEPNYGRGGYGGGEVSCDSLKEGSNSGSYSTISAKGGKQESGVKLAYYKST